MADELQDIMQQFMDAVAGDIRQGIPSVTGKTRASIEATATQTGVGLFSKLRGEITAPAYVYTFEFGRGPTRNTTAGSPTLREAIEQWIIDKNFRWTRTVKKGNKTVIKTLTPKQMSWAIAIKIHNEGNRLFRRLRGGQTGVITDPTNDRRVDAFVKVFSTKVGRLILADIIKGIESKTI